MKRQKQWLVSIVGALTALTINSVTWAGGAVPLDNRLPAWGDFGGSRVDFTNIDIRYSNGKGKNDTVFFGESNSNSVISLNATGFSNVIFDGELVIDANISSKGVLREGSTFGIYSNDVSLFGTDYITEYGCDHRGNNCSTGSLVYGGTLTAFGWSGSEGILEFSIGQLGGWAHDNLTPSAMDEHIYLDVGVFSLNDVSSVKSFMATADGFAVLDNP